ncbi:MAG: hypothetical protein SFW63_09095 [Alphaproteobacteria bacterium]|nr:hypothetical protein [Alphaproteobacteria bacterium]
MSEELKYLADITDETHRRLHQGLARAFKALGELPGIYLDTDKLVQTKFTDSADGPALEFDIGLSLDQAREHFKSLFKTEKEAREHADAIDNNADEMLHNINLQLKKRLSEIKHKTFKFDEAFTPVEEDDKKAQMEARGASTTENYSKFIAAKTLEDLVGGLNKLLEELGVPENERVTIPERGRK